MRVLSLILEHVYRHLNYRVGRFDKEDKDRIFCDLIQLSKISLLRFKYTYITLSNLKRPHQNLHWPMLTLNGYLPWCDDNNPGFDEYSVDKKKKNRFLLCSHSKSLITNLNQKIYKHKTWIFSTLCEIKIPQVSEKKGNLFIC